MVNLHIKSEAHFLLKATEVHSNHSVDKGFFVDMVVGCFLKKTEKSIVYYAWQQCVFEECHFINEFEFIICLFWAVSS